MPATMAAATPRKRSVAGLRMPSAPEARGPPRRVPGSTRFLRAIVDARLIGDPVDFPGPAPIGGVGLFEMRRIRRDLRPDVANEDGSAFPELLVVELPAA